MSSGELLAAAQTAHAFGLCVVPAKPDGSKRPWPDGYSWDKYKTTRSTSDEVQSWFAWPRPRGLEGNDYDGFGIVCGKVSKGLECLELEGRAVDEGLYDELMSAAYKAGLAPLLNTIRAGYEESTPSGGVHWLYRCEETSTTKLARDADGDCLIETRGEGGFVIVSPSGGRTHPSGRSWELRTGDFSNIATITIAQRHALLDLARSFDLSDDLFGGDGESQEQHELDPDRPGDDFILRTTWHDVLRPHNWVPLYTHGEVTSWRRPGKRDGVSATTNYGGSDLFYPFTSSSQFTPERGYNRFSVYAILNHGGDFSAAAQALADAGYGKSLAHTIVDRQTNATGGGLIPETSDPPPSSVMTIVDNDDSEEQRSIETVERSEDDTPHMPGVFECTDLGNARRLVHAHGRDIRYVPKLGRWLVWDGRRWADDETGEVMRMAKRVSEGIATEALDVASPADEKRLVKWWQSSQSADKLRAMISLATTEQSIPIGVEALDSNRYTLNVLNGSIDLRTGKIRPHERKDLITRLCSVDFDPEAQAPTWTNFLERILPDPDLRDWIQKAVGYSITGDVSEQVLFFAHGGGSNGKSTMLGTLQAILGDYAGTAPTDLLIASSGDQHPTGIATLRGRRYVVASETEQNRYLAESLVKQLTGGDVIVARQMRQDFFQFDPTHKLWLQANHKPNVRGTDEGIWRRLRLIPFTVQIPAEERDPDLMEKLAEEAPGILAWAVRGSVAWANHRLGTVAAVSGATDDYRLEEDHLGRFMADCCHVGPDLSVTAAQLRSVYTTWVEAQGERARAEKTIARDLEERGFIRAREGTSRIRVWKGFAIASGAGSVAPVDNFGETSERYL